MGKQPVRRVTRSALVQRVKRALSLEGKILRAGRGDQTLGQFYLVDGDRIIATYVDIAQLARRMGLLRPWEDVGP